MISVVVPVFNTSEFLEKVIRSLQAQSGQVEAEMIFVDNGSTDGSREILENHPDLRVIDEPERGSYAARNAGLRMARGEIIAFTDSDCYPRPDWLQTIRAGFESPTAQVLLGARVPEHSSVALDLIADYENTKSGFVCASDDPRVYCGHTNNMAVRREAWQRCGPFLHRERGSDTIFVRRVAETFGCAAVAYDADMVVQHAELNSIAAYYNKVRTYGRSRQQYRHVTDVRPLSFAERWRVFRHATRNRGLLEAAFLMMLLGGGQVAWWLGESSVDRNSR